MPKASDKEQDVKKETEETDDDDVPKADSGYRVTPEIILGKVHRRLSKKDLIQ